MPIPLMVNPSRMYPIPKVARPKIIGCFRPNLSDIKPAARPKTAMKTYLKFVPKYNSDSNSVVTIKPRARLEATVNINHGQR